MLLIVLVVACVLAVVLAALRMFGPPPQERMLQLLRFDRWLRNRSPKRLWIEIIALAIAVALLIVLFDWWIVSRLTPATLESLLLG